MAGLYLGKGTAVQTQHQQRTPLEADRPWTRHRGSASVDREPPYRVHHFTAWRLVLLLTWVFTVSPAY